MDSYNLEEYLHKIFNNILHVDSNPAILNTTEVFKEDGKIKHVNKKEEYILTEFIIESVDDLEQTIISEINQISDIKQIDFYPTSFLKKLFNRYNYDSLSKELDYIKDEEYFIITSSKIDKYLDVDCDVRINESLGDTLIIVKKDSKVVVNKYIKESSDYITIQLHIDPKYFSVVTLN
jgi:uncharacterized protein YlbG (UPF0298 family)